MTTFDEAAFRERIDPAVYPDIEKVEVFGEIDSTNTYLRDQLAPEKGSFRVVLAGHQTAGRGREDRRWMSAPGCSLCLSLSHAFERPPQNLSALTLALGVGAVEALARLGTDRVRLKWPNDLMVGDAKLGGILTETQVRRRDVAVVIAGIGLNLVLPEHLKETFATTYAADATALDALLPVQPPREAVAAALVVAWRSVFLQYQAGGFARFMQRFAAVDWLAGRDVVVATPGDPVTGRAAGIGETGALLIDTTSGPVPVISGSVIAAESV